MMAERAICLGYCLGRDLDMGRCTAVSDPEMSQRCPDRTASSEFISTAREVDKRSSLVWFIPSHVGLVIA